MARVQCVACGGIYDTACADGLDYFHVCPPLSAAQIAAAVSSGALALPAGVTPAQAAASGRYLRSNARNENVVGRSTHADTPPPIVSVGAGVIAAPIDASAAPIVVDVAPAVTVPAGTPILIAW